VERQRLVTSTNPENGIVTYQYDGNHHVTQRVDAKSTALRNSGSRHLPATASDQFGNPNCTLQTTNVYFGRKLIALAELFPDNKLYRPGGYL
jgi:YD repeat-containing protein